MQLALYKSKISVLLPDSMLMNEDTLLLKTRKIGIVARIATIFRIGEILFYKDTGSDEDRNILKEICHHITCPPYLRKYTHHSKNLKYTAILPPIHSPNHFGIQYKNNSYISGIVIDNREGVIRVDIGKHKFIEIQTSRNLNKGEFIILQHSKQSSAIQDDLPSHLYWVTGYEILSVSLEEYIEHHPNSYTIAASKSGNQVTEENLRHIQSIESPRFYLAIGPLKGSFKKYIRNPKCIDQWMNVIPNQGTKTVKVEEALHSALTLLNLCSLNFK